MKTRFAISFAVAVLSGVIGVRLVYKRGDPSATLAQVERGLAAAFKRKTFFVAEPIGGTSWKTYIVQRNLSGRTLEIAIDHKPTQQELDAILDQVNASWRTTDFRLPHSLAGGVRSVTQIAPPGEEVEKLCQGLTWPNNEIAMAKAMLLYESNPHWGIRSERIWQHRGELAARPWDGEEPARLLTRRLQFAALGVVLGFAAGFGSVTLLGWSWNFLLARVRELFDAICGR